LVGSYVHTELLQNNSPERSGRKTSEKGLNTIGRQVRWDAAENADESAKRSQAARGRVNVKVEPFSSLLFFAHILPP
jgi:hypothetical protein